MLKELTADEIASTRGSAPPLEGVVGRVPGVSGRIECSATLRREPAGGAPGRRRSAEPHLPGRRADHRGELSIRIHRPFGSTICWCRRRSARSLRRSAERKGVANSGDRRRNRRNDQLRPSRSAGTLHRIRVHRCLRRASRRTPSTSSPSIRSLQFRTLDIERDPLEQGFEPHSFDLIIASDVLHATKDLRKTLDQIKQLLGSGGTVVIVELTRPWLFMTLIFGLLKGWWLFDDDVRRDEPCISQETWKGLLHDAGFSGTVCIADCPDGRQRSAFGDSRARSAVAASPALAPQTSRRIESLAAVRRRRRCRPPERRSGARPQARERGDARHPGDARRRVPTTRSVELQHPRRQFR